MLCYTTGIGRGANHYPLCPLWKVIYPTPSIQSISNSLQALDGFRLSTNGTHWSLVNKAGKTIWTGGGADQEESMRTLLVVALNQTAKRLESYEE